MACLALGVALVFSGTACQSDAVRAFRGARHYAEGNRALDRGDTLRAITELRRAAALVPHASEIQNHLGLAYLAEGADSEARAAFERAIVLDCDNQPARANLARMQVSAGVPENPSRGLESRGDDRRSSPSAEAERSSGDGR